MTLIILFVMLIYFIGVVLCAGRLYASIYEAYLPFGLEGLEEDIYKMFFKDSSSRFIILTSWVGFFVALGVYFEENEEHFLKFKK